MSHVLEPDLIWTGKSFESGLQVEIRPDGKFGRVGRLGLPATRLAGRAMIPGFVNVHSHAFQRGLRGRGERFPAAAGSFWTWREAMYGLVDRLEPAEFRTLCLRAFREMLAAGITTVGEFHYLHHTPGTRDFQYDRLVLDAASEAGIRIVLLNAYYRTGGVGQPLKGPQKRFETPDPAAFWDHMDRLGEDLDARRQSLGAVAHSIRAATPEEITGLHAEARRRDMVLHLHVEEQRQEIEDAVAAYGRRPMAILNHVLPDAARVTAVHCTHTAREDMDRFQQQGGTVCICPITEANLGDGIADVPHILSTQGRICLGSDSNARISMLEEMRWLEYVQRLAREQRGILRDEHGQVARTLLDCATTAGAGALGIPAGRIAPWTWADFVAVDLSAATLAGWEPDTLVESLVFGAGSEVVGEVWVGGERVVGGIG